MAENTVIPLGAGGDTIATDDIAGIKFQRIKLVHGVDGINAGDVATSNPLPVGDAGGTLTVDAPVGTPVFVRLSDGAAAITTLPVSVASVPSHAVTNAGTFVVQENGAALTALQLIDDAVATTAAAIPTKGLAVSGTDGTNARVLKTDASGELQVDVLTIPAVTNAGTFAVQVDGAALTALQLLDDTIFTDDAAFTPATSKVSATGFLADDTATDSVDEGDIGIGRMTLDRKQYVVNEIESSSARASGVARVPKFAVISGATSGNNTLVAAAGAGLKIRVLSLYLVAAGTVGVKFQSGAAGTDLCGLMSYIANTGIALPFNPLGHFETAANTLLNMNLNAAIQVSGGLTYVEAT